VPDWSEIRCRFPPKSPAAFDRNQVPVCSDFCTPKAWKAVMLIGPRYLRYIVIPSAYFRYHQMIRYIIRQNTCVDLFGGRPFAPGKLASLGRFSDNAARPMEVRSPMRAVGQIFGARTNTTALLWLTDDRNPIGSDAPARYSLAKTEGCGLDEGVL
jgi:hypothetical protein